MKKFLADILFIFGCCFIGAFVFIYFGAEFTLLFTGLVLVVLSVLISLNEKKD